MAAEKLEVKFVGNKVVDLPDKYCSCDPDTGTTAFINNKVITKLH